MGTATQTEVKEQIELDVFFDSSASRCHRIGAYRLKGFGSACSRGCQEGIPVINIDIQLDAQLLEQAGVEVAFVGPDNFAAAYEVGKLLGKKLRNEDKVAIIEGLAVAIMRGSVKEVSSKR